MALQFLHPINFFIDYGNKGTNVDVGQEGGPQGNPRGTIQPRPYPSTDPVGNTNSFGMMLMPMPFGQANWLRNVPRSNQFSSNTGPKIEIEGVVKQQTTRISF
jgi:hypothetical protein